LGDERTRLKVKRRKVPTSEVPSAISKNRIEDVVIIVDLRAEVVGLSEHELIFLDFIDPDLLVRGNQDHAIQIVHVEVSPPAKLRPPEGVGLGGRSVSARNLRVSGCISIEIQKANSYHSKKQIAIIFELSRKQVIRFNFPSF
jgi:hypothetical protein